MGIGYTPHAMTDTHKPGFLARFRMFAADIKVSHTVFAMPFALLATFLAAGGWPHWTILLLIVLCMIFARTTAMAANRLLDARLDHLNPRTAGRAIPAGRLTSRYYFFAIVLCIIGFELSSAGFLLLHQNPWPLIFSLPVLAYISAYPLLKRFTQICHYYLGLALGLAPIGAYLATAGYVTRDPLLICFSILTWTAGFDILYACQDYQSDLQTGVFSVPARLGIPRALWVARFTHLLSWSLLALLWWQSPQLHLLFAIAVGIAAVLLIVEHLLVKPTDLSKINLAFATINGIISILLGLLGILDVLVGR